MINEGNEQAHGHGNSDGDGCHGDGGGACSTVMFILYFQSGPVGTQGPRDSKSTTQNSHILPFIWGFIVGI